MRILLLSILLISFLSAWVHAQVVLPAYQGVYNTTEMECPETITDYDGNIYDVVKIGNQCWIAENLNVTHDAAGNTITRRCYNNQASNCDVYGGLYKWNTIMNGASSSNSNPSGVQGICPDGWHLPSDAEWKEMEMALGMSQAEADGTGWRGTNEGSKLAGNAGLWTDGALENDSDFGTSGFSALPGGYRNDSGNFYGMGYGACFWSSTEYSSLGAWGRRLSYTGVGVDRGGSNKGYGFSIRCVKD